MKAVIMAGGEGQRLRPITCTQPKPMAELLNRPTMEYCVRLLKQHGLKDITATLHYIPNAIKDYFGDGSAFGVKMSYSVEDEPMGTAGSVRFAVGRYAEEGEEVFVISGDALTDINISEVIAEHRKSGAYATIVLKKVKNPSEYGVVLKDKNGFITRFLEKPMPNEVFSDFVNTGIYILKSDAVKLIPKTGAFDFSKDLFPLMMQKNMPIFGFEADCYWCDIGDIREYMAAQCDLMNEKCRIEVPNKKHNGIYIEDGAMISEEAVIVPPCYIGSGAEIADNVIIGPEAVVGSGCRIGRNSSIKHSVLMKNVRLRENCEIRGAIICEDVHIGNRTSVFEYAVIGAKTQTDRGVTVDSGVLVWPQKKLESEKRYSSNVVWQKEIDSFASLSTMGYADHELTPERAAIIGEAAGCILSGEGSIAIATDGSQQSMMIKHAVISGVVSQGTDVLDMGFCGISQFEFTIRSLSLNGGVYIKMKHDDAHFAEITVCDKYGTQLLANDMRKLQKEIGKGAKPPVTGRRLGIVERSVGSTRAYEAELMRRIQIPKLKRDDDFSVIVASQPSFYDTVARMLLPKGIRVRYLPYENRDALLKTMLQKDAKIGFVVNKDNIIEETFVGEERIESEKLTTVILLDYIRDGGKNTLLLSSDIPDEYAQFLCENGARVERVPNDRSILIKKSCEKSSYMPEVFDAEGRIAKAVSLMLQKKMELFLNALPKVFTSENENSCSWKEIGRVLRNLVESENDDRVELIDGVRIRSDEGWILVKPNNSFTACRVIAGSYEQEYAEELYELYSKKVNEILKEKS